MSRTWAILLLGAGLVAGCAQSSSETEVIPTVQYRKSVYSTRTNAVYGYCFVEFSPLAGPPTAPTLLEPDTLVACNGVRAVISGSGYYANFPHENGEQVRVTVVRPQSGSTIVDYHPIQSPP